ncbi:hypothetical protein OBBRIDRAFT_548458 [Obba rivulosa]|uniref:MYND-type domain-containing protein n=1 Tax=Obba rivulosa TaxID=1052685 RepID=A0A8E2DK53_9APHY|nr:hypothetical protein OBBRIDRAFT_548458 [Obba rivulosa]
MSLHGAWDRRDPALLSSLVTLFLQSMPSSSNECFCAKMASASLKLLDGVGDPAAMLCLRTQFPALLDTCMKFVAQPRTQDEVQTLAESMELSWRNCQCGMSNPLVSSLHRFAASNPDPRVYDNPLWGLLDTIVPILADCVPLIDSDMRKLSRANQRAIGSGGSITWPMDLNAALPFGPEQSFKAILAWVDFFDGPHLFKLIHALSNLLGSHVSRRILVSSPNVCLALARRTRKIILDWSEHPRSPSAALQGINGLSGCALFLSPFMSADDSELQQFTSQTTRDGAPMALVCDQVLKFVPQHESAIPPFPGRATCLRIVCPTFLILGGRFLALLKLSAYQLSKYHPRLALVSQHPSLSTAGPFYVIYTHLMILGHDGVCGARGCTVTTSSAGKKFSLCSSCGLLPYCSKSCQKNGWKDELSPHRSFCTKMRTFSDLALRSGKLDVQNPSDFAEKCKSAGVQETLAGEISEHLRVILSPTPVQNA